MGRAAAFDPRPLTLERDPSPTLSVVSALTVSRLARHGGDWQLRCVEVAADDREWMPVLGTGKERQLSEKEQEKQDETEELRPAGQDEARAFRERMDWKPGDVQVLTPEEAARRIGRPLEDLEDEAKPLPTARLVPSVRPRVKEARELATDGELSLQEKLAQIEALAREEEREGYPNGAGPRLQGDCGDDRRRRQPRASHREPS